METRSSHAMGVMQNKLAARYNFSIGDLLKESWSQIDGFKKSFWGAAFWIAIILGLFGAIMGVIATYANDTDTNKMMIQVISQVFSTLLIIPMSVGIAMMGLRRSVNIPVKASQVFKYFRRFGAIISVYLVQYFIYFLIVVMILYTLGMAKHVSSPSLFWLCRAATVIFTALLVYLMIGYMFALIVRVEKKLSIISSLIASRKAVNQHWFKIFFTFILMNILLIAGSIPLFIGLIWVLPLMVMMYANLYRTMFGIEEVR